MNIETLLRQRDLLTDDQLAFLQGKANEEGLRVDQSAVKAGLMSEDQWLEALADEFGYEVVDLSNFEAEQELLSLLPTNLIFKYEALPLRIENGELVVAINDALEVDGLDHLSSLSGYPIRPALGRRREIMDLIKASLGVGGDTINEMVRLQSDDDEDVDDLLDGLDHDMGELAESAQAPSVIRLVNELLVEAVEQRASDVHIEPHETGLTIRFRVDGMLRVQPFPAEINQFAAAIVTRMKIMSRLNIAEKRLPQDGRIKLRIARREIDIRVSIIPMVNGEGIVLRLLDKDRMVFNLQNVGMPQHIDQTFRRLIELPHGIVLVTGPTGSGKSSTLYSALNEIKSPTTKIITVEDPVEYQSQGISQIQVHSKIGLTFAAGLRSILRHDPDVILIGEIRDGETAQSAIQASLTGHLVFSTLHTNDAPGAMTRLIDMGVEPYLVASTVEGVLAQRLVRRLCPVCKRHHNPHADDLPQDFRPTESDTIYDAVGCRECRETGYSGRIGIFELMVNDSSIKELTIQNASSGTIRQHAIQEGMLSLRDCGWLRVQEGITSIDEIARVTKGDVI